VTAQAKAQADSLRSAQRVRVWLFLQGKGLAGGNAGEHGVGSGGVREHDGESDGGDHEDDRGPAGELGEQVGGAAGTKGGLRALSAEGAGEISRFALLEEDDGDEEEADNDVNDDEKNEHALRRNLRPVGGGKF
jgi:hypothetical protein